MDQRVAVRDGPLLRSASHALARVLRSPLVGKVGAWDDRIV